MDVCSDDETTNVEDEANAHMDEKYFEFNNHETDELLSLLISWNLEDLYNHFYGIFLCYLRQKFFSPF